LKPQTEITDFRKVLELAVSDGKSIMVGGHAVNFWALFYFPRIETELRQFMPFTSKDLDFYGDIHLLEKLLKSFGGLKRMSHPRGPVIGQVELEIDGAKRIVEVLHSVHGLSPKDLAKAVPPVLEVDQCKARVLDPVSLLKSKIHNAADFSQEERNDVRHVKIMLLCNREFILDALEEAKRGKVPQRNLVNLLGSIRYVISDSKAEKVRTLGKVDLQQVWPMQELKSCGLSKVVGFLRHQIYSV
jgi:hypothetical protein